MKSIFLLVILTLSIAITGSVFAEPPHDEVNPIRVLKAALNLDDDQIMALGEIIQTRATEVKAIKAEIHETQALLEDLLKNEEPDQAEVGGLVLDIRALKQEVGQGHAAYQQSFLDLLTEMQHQRLGHIRRIQVAERAADVLQHLKLF